MWTSIYHDEHLRPIYISSIILYSISNAVKQCSLPSASYSLLISQAWEKREECLAAQESTNPHLAKSGKSATGWTV